MNDKNSYFSFEQFLTHFVLIFQSYKNYTSITYNLVSSLALHPQKAQEKKEKETRKKKRQDIVVKEVAGKVYILGEICYMSNTF